MAPTFRISEAATVAQVDGACSLIEEYAAQIGTSMGVDLGFQNLSAELLKLPDMYGPPSGCLLLASRDDEWIGCCALRRFTDEVGEMKRLYIKPEVRGANLGRHLTERLVAKARALGYRRMVLDTLEAMVPSQPLYRPFCF